MLAVYLYLGPVYTQLFRIRLNIRLKLDNLLIWTFSKTYYNYLTIDCWCLINYVLQTRLLGILSFFYERKGSFYSCVYYDTFSPLNNMNNFIIVNCLQHVLFTIIR